MQEYGTYAIGLFAQLLFSARLIVQWIKSEKSGKVLSPTLFWQLSLLASLLLMFYGLLRNDLVIILGQVFSYFIYFRNLQYKNVWHHIPKFIRIVALVFPALAMIGWSIQYPYSWHYLLHNPDISGFMLTWGSFGQVIFTLRFVYQWYHSEKQKQSVLPAGFWFISLSGSLLIIIYGIYREDPILILGQSFGFIIYIRNIILFFKGSSKTAEMQEDGEKKITT